MFIRNGGFNIFVALVGSLGGWLVWFIIGFVFVFRFFIGEGGVFEGFFEVEG